MPKDVILTPEGLEKLKASSSDLQTDKRREVAERIKEAREFGDISENSEYDDAKNEQTMLEQRIAQLEEQLRSAQVVDAKDLSTDVVQVGVDRARQGREDRQVDKYTIVGSAEANPAEKQALQRVARRQGAASATSAARSSTCPVPERQAAQAQDHQDRRRL